MAYSNRPYCVCGWGGGGGGGGGGVILINGIFK